MRKTHTVLESGLHMLLWKEGKYFVAKCVEVEVASQGKTKIEALKNIEEALDLFFENEKVHVPKKLNMLELLKIPLKISYA